MDKLAGYGSDDDYDDSPKDKKGESTSTAGYDYYARNSGQHNKQLPTKQVDVNYEEVQMDLSEDSNNSDSSSKSRDTPSRRQDRSSSKSSRSSDHRKDNGRDEDRYSSRDSPKYYSKSKRDDEDDRYRRRDDRRDDRDRYGSRNRDNRDKYRDDRSRNYRTKRSSSRERRSRSPRKPDFRGSPRKPDFRGKRSSSREREMKATYQRRFDRGPPKPEQEKIEINKPVEPPPMKQEPDKDRFYMPGITGRFKDQIERRKLLESLASYNFRWQKKDPERKECPATSTTAGKVWQATTFAQDSDGKVASKFKRLMGIKESTEGPKGTMDTLKKQEEMFSSMEQQYEVARTATHTMRGVGLGFGSFQR
ncbi:Small acidic protein family [Popillia japonica]|uniref:Small acidic protein family n=1 Tax=Popillia japonica TaxID=7064 RepID=A0AAW1N6R3_POPJA